MTAFLAACFIDAAQINILIDAIFPMVASGFALAAGGIGGLLFLASMLNRDFPPALLQAPFDMPWPLK